MPPYGGLLEPRGWKLKLLNSVFCVYSPEPQTIVVVAVVVVVVVAIKKSIVEFAKNNDK